MMNDATTFRSSRQRFPVSLGIAAGYLVLTGILTLIWPLLGIGPHHPEFEAKDIAFKAGRYTREITFGVLFVIAGSGLYRRRNWARRLALALLTITTIYSAHQFAWGFAHGRPSLAVLSFAWGIIVAWNGIWFGLIFKRTSREAMLAKPMVTTPPDVEQPEFKCLECQTAIQRDEVKCPKCGWTWKEEVKAEEETTPIDPQAKRVDLTRDVGL